MTTDPQQALEHLQKIAATSPTSAIEEALRREVWTPGTPWHHEDMLCYCAQLATKLGEWRLAGLAAYQAQWLHKERSGEMERWGLPMLPGLESAARDYNLVRHIPLHSRNVMMRRVQINDREFLTRLFSDAHFVRQYSRTTHGMVEQRVYRLIRSDDGQAPKSHDPWAWIICDSRGEPIGLMEFSSPNFTQGSVDLALGFIQPHFGTLAAEAYAIGTFIAFHHMDLVRVTGHVYGDNHRSNQLDARMGMLPEYTLNGMVQDVSSGDDVPLTIYAMLRDEVQQWPRVKRIMRHFFTPSAPDLLRDQMSELSTKILGRGLSWDIFPPERIPFIPAPDNHAGKPDQSSLNNLPVQVEWDDMRLRSITEEDSCQVSDWLKMDDFLVAYPHQFDLCDDNDSLQRLSVNEDGLQFWILEELRSPEEWFPCGLIGVEVLNHCPVVFIVAGFTHDTHAKTQHSIHSRVISKIFTLFPAAFVYLKVPHKSPGHDMLHNWSQLNPCGTERQYQTFPGKDRVDMTYFRVAPEPQPPRKGVD